jgi:prepilin-type N-terminal cleavage/methylation domain-containing protein
MYLSSFKKNSNGFTLIELLVVVAIIGLLASIVLASVNSARLKGDTAKRVSDLREIQTALEMYYNDYSAYPSTPGNAWQSQCSSWGSFASNAVIPGLVPTYMPSFPADPTMSGVLSNCYIYRSNGTDYALLDYSLVDVGWVTSMYFQYPAFLDPEREGGATTQCGTSSNSWSWKLSSTGGICW